MNSGEKGEFWANVAKFSVGLGGCVNSRASSAKGTRLDFSELFCESRRL